MQIHLTPAERDRFWSHVDKSGGLFACWPWLIHRHEGGYGRLGIRGRLYLSHRVAWMLTVGPIPDGLYVLHNCPGADNPACCNPAHLWLGTREQNNADRVAKGRNGSAPGEAHGQARLTAQQVREIRQRYARGGVLERDLGRDYGVARPTINCILRRATWKHVD